MSWPEEQTLRAILELPGVSGQTREDIEDYLSDGETIRRQEAREADEIESMARMVNAARADRGELQELIDASEHRDLKRRLHAAVQAHYGQLIDARKI